MYVIYECLLKARDNPDDWVVLILQLFFNLEVDLANHSSQVVQSLNFVLIWQILTLVVDKFAEPSCVAKRVVEIERDLADTIVCERMFG